MLTQEQIRKLCSKDPAAAAAIANYVMSSGNGGQLSQCPPAPNLQQQPATGCPPGSASGGGNPWGPDYNGDQAYGSLFQHQDRHVVDAVEGGPRGLLHTRQTTFTPAGAISSGPITRDATLGLTAGTAFLNLDPAFEDRTRGRYIAGLIFGEPFLTFPTDFATNLGAGGRTYESVAAQIANSTVVTVRKGTQEQHEACLRPLIITPFGRVVAPLVMVPTWGNFQSIRVQFDFVSPPAKVATYDISFEVCWVWVKHEKYQYRR